MYEEVVRKSERQKDFPLLIITCDYFELLLYFLCSYLILVHQAITKNQNMKINDTRCRRTIREKTLDRGKPSQELFL